jgi:transposase
MMNAYQYVGVDVSKDTLDYALDSSKKVQQIHNRAASIRKWLAKLDRASVCLVLEPTGTYSDKLVQVASEMGVAFALVDPSKSHYYAKSEGHIHKNDRQAARSLLSYAQKNHLQPAQMPSEAQQQRKQLLSVLHSLTKQQTMLRNQIHAQDQLYRPNQVAKASLEAALSTVEQQIERLEAELHDLDGEEEAHQMKMMQTVVGIGPKSARQIMRYLGDFSTFTHVKQVLKFVGVVPGGHTSGTSVKAPERITKRGPKSLRATLYVAARSARKHNLACKELYERLRGRGKPHKQAMIAVVAKLIKQVFAVVTSQTEFDNQYHLQYR